MDTKDALHALVDTLPDTVLDEALDFLGRLARGEPTNRRSESARVGEPPPFVQWSAFNDGAASTLDDLARRQGVAPIDDFNSLIVNIAPPDEFADEFNQTIRRWRNEA